jgi:hypothetical protein
MTVDLDGKWRGLDIEPCRRTSLSAINRLPHTRQNLGEPLLELFVARIEPDPLHRPGSPYIASSHDLVDEPPRLAVRVQRPSLATGASACGSAHAVNVSGQSARDVVLQDMRDAAAG